MRGALPSSQAAGLTSSTCHTLHGLSPPPAPSTVWRLMFVSSFRRVSTLVGSPDPMRPSSQRGQRLSLRRCLLFIPPMTTHHRRLTPSRHSHPSLPTLPPTLPHSLIPPSWMSSLAAFHAALLPTMLAGAMSISVGHSVICPHALLPPGPRLLLHLVPLPTPPSALAVVPPRCGLSSSFSMLVASRSRRAPGSWVAASSPYVRMVIRHPLVRSAPSPSVVSSVVSSL